METGPTNHVLLGPLTESIRRGNCVAVIGAGVSSPDYPTWEQLTRRLCKACDVGPLDAVDVSPLSLASAAKRKNPAAYFAELERVFCKRKRALRSADRYHLLARISFVAYVTLNFDPMLETILHKHRNVSVSAYPWLSPKALRGQQLVYMHGRLPLGGRDAANTPLVLASEDFEEAYSGRSRLPAFVETMLCDYDVCFLGCRPDEANMKRLFETCNALREQHYGLDKMGKPRWFLLSHQPFPQVEPVGGLVVQYPQKGETFIGFDEVLQYWAGWEKPRTVEDFNRPEDFDRPFDANTRPGR